jgi:dephospho-CoA kinase
MAKTKAAANVSMILGITGGIGCGKSTAAAAFAAADFKRLDSDEWVRTRVLTTPMVKAGLQDRFGSEVIGPDGEVDRAFLAAKVFTNDAELRWLEELIHPRLYALWRMAFRDEPSRRWAVEVPLLFEKSLENWFDFTICVASSPAQQLARLEQRGLSRALAEQRISKQLPLAQKIERADFVLWNDGSREFLLEQISRLIVSLSTTR